MAILIVGITVCGSAITCPKETACDLTQFAAEKTCSSTPVQSRLKPCQLKQVFSLQKFQIQNDSSRTVDPIRAGLAAISFPPLMQHAGHISKLPRPDTPPALSSPLFLLNSSFLC
ncbi:MAG: hypothetical protein ACOC3W_11485 [Thermodesulfobacteriota bacterium]